VFGHFLRIGEQALGAAGIFQRIPGHRPRAGNRADGDTSIAQANKDFRAGANEAHIAKVHVEHEGGRVEAAQCTVEADRLSAERCRQALAGHDLEDVAGADIIAALIDDLEIAVLGGVGCQRHVNGRLVLWRGFGQAFEPGLDRIEQGVDRRLIAVFDAADKQDFLIDMIEHDHDPGNDQQRFGNVQRVLGGDGHRFDMLDHVIADIAERAGRHGRQGGFGFGLGESDEVAQRLDGIIRSAERGGKIARLRHGGDTVLDAEPVVGLQADKGIAAKALAAGNGFEQECAGRIGAELQHRTDGCFNIPDAPANDQTGWFHCSVAIDFL